MVIETVEVYNSDGNEARINKTDIAEWEARGYFQKGGKDAVQRREEKAEKAEEVKPDQESDDLKLISGIGEDLEYVLKAAGIDSFAELANCSVKNLVAFPGIGTKKAERIITRAKVMATEW